MQVLLQREKKKPLAVDVSLCNIAPPDDSSKTLARAVKWMMMARCMVLGAFMMAAKTVEVQADYAK